MDSGKIGRFSTRWFFTNIAYFLTINETAPAFLPELFLLSTTISDWGKLIRRGKV
ncbi:hypothetical protein CLOSTMETH_01979 [[Clostridium] methylpentosum DSM 5476]|uniref:Uncharacterized protein n=1 Tax=[Clostridium] methylpentosum DSM 5476 TaxID=537013 RepID=C0EDQ1_9FIRM|nr:hypothetical protein CLOSTMETH_01979 [[Clostridium] methylpentosum DSM 5476]